MSVREEIRTTGRELVDRVRELIAEGNVSKIHIHDADGGLRLEMPVTVGAITGGVVVIAAPWLAVLGAIAAFVTDLRIEVERVHPQPGPDVTETGQEGDPPFGDHLPI